ncbi:MAG TPA: hypothetical protein VNZ44_12790, partial [Pyrinomonadaceae bacterium]|nr:hypothetical protein [Pyrinomonadaceae bacterium]
ITGFNTDIPYDGVTYHVQTEDKGLDTPLILSLVYVGGAIIAAKRTPYEDLLAKGFDEKVLTERLQRQHKLICAAIKQGRVNELKKMNAPNGGAKAEADAAKEAAAQPAPDAAAKASGQRRKKSEPPAPAEAAPSAEAAPPVETPPTVETAPPPVETAPPPAEAAQTPVEATPPPAEKAAPPVQTAAPPRAEPPAKPPKPPIKSPIEVSRVPPGRRNAGPAAETTAGTAGQDMVILTTLSDEVSALGDFLYKPTPDAPAAPAAEAPPADEPIPVEPIPVEPLEEDVAEAPRDVSDGLALRLLDDEGDFRAGQLATIKIYVGRGDYGQRPIFDASVTVKVLGSSFRPIILTTTTDMAGVAVVRALLPRFSSGRAAIIIRATVGEDSAELRRIIRQQ